jgi:glycerophosphoryl diester phosphodiesterase
LLGVNKLELLQDLGQALTDFFMGLIPRKTPHRDAINKCKIVSHRGAHDNKHILENTMDAFQKALSIGVYGIEFDIRWTKDMVPIVHHDKSLLRVFEEDILIRDLSFDELRRSYPKIPSLVEVVKEFGGKIHLFIEIKTEFIIDLDKQKSILTEVLSTIEPVEDFHFLSLTEGNYHHYNHFPKGVYIMVATTNTNTTSNTVVKNNFAGVTGHYILLDSKIQLKHQSFNQQVGTGFPKGKNALKREINRGVDWVFTNHPKILNEFLIEMKGRK